jgi:hypothetical protein
MAINVPSTPRNGRRQAAASTRPAGSNSRKCGSPKCRSIVRLHRSFGRAKSVKPAQQNDERVPSGARLVHQFARVGNMAIGLVKATCLAVRLRRRAPIRRHSSAASAGKCGPFAVRKLRKFESLWPPRCGHSRTRTCAEQTDPDRAAHRVKPRIRRSSGLERLDATGG